MLGQQNKRATGALKTTMQHGTAFTHAHASAGPYLAVVVARSKGLLDIVAGVKLRVRQQPLEAHAALDELVPEVLGRVVELAAESGVPMVLNCVVCAPFQQLGQRSPLVGVDLLCLQE